MPLYCILWGTVILGIGISFFYYAVQISKDRESFAKYPPRLPNLLAILTGEEKPLRGFRNRINFWGDIAGVGWGLFGMHALLFAHYFSRRSIDLVEWWGISSDTVHMLLLLSILIVYFLFALFFAGIPRRRYWGMILLGMSVLLIDTCVHFMYSELTLKTSASFVHGLSAWYLLCFTLLGAAGLWVFRRKT